MEWDYIVIGAGSAGCALVHELAKGGTASVLLLESGGSDRSPLIKLPAAVLAACERFDWGYRSNPDPTRNGATEGWVRGRVIGGCSSVNGMLYVRGANEDYDRWNRLCGNTGGWSAEDIIPLYREIERSDQPGEERGREGRLFVTTTRHPHQVTQRFIQAAQHAGLSPNSDFNGRSQDGVGYMQRTQRHGLRWSAADAFLRPVMGRRNLTILTHATVERIEMKEGRASGVVYVKGGRRTTATARDVVVCAGALNTPKILMLSGIGPPEELNRWGIDSIVPSPQVGRNLREHPFVRIVYRSKLSTYNLTGGAPQKLGIAAKFLVHQEGPIASGYEAAAFLRTLGAEPSPDVMLYFGAMAYFGKVGGNPKLADFPAFMIGVALMRPLSSGRVRLASPNAEDPPSIDIDLFSDRSDLHGLVRGVQAARSIAAKAPLAEIIEEEVMPGDQHESTAQLEDYIQAKAEVSSHPLGTCRMGVGRDAVVDPTLLVRGTENLWIADASIMPDHLSANLNAVCMMIGLKLGKHLNARAVAGTPSPMTGAAAMANRTSY